MASTIKSVLVCAPISHSTTTAPHHRRNRTMNRVSLIAIVIVASAVVLVVASSTVSATDYDYHKKPLEIKHVWKKHDYKHGYGHDDYGKGYGKTLVGHSKVYHIQKHGNSVFKVFLNPR